VKPATIPERESICKQLTVATTSTEGMSGTDCKDTNNRIAVCNSRKASNSSEGHADAATSRRPATAGTPPTARTSATAGMQLAVGASERQVTPAFKKDALYSNEASNNTRNREYMQTINSSDDIYRRDVRNRL
jgi:hypothetical protein